MVSPSVAEKPELVTTCVDCFMSSSSSSLFTLIFIYSHDIWSNSYKKKKKKGAEIDILRLKTFSSFKIFKSV